MIHFRWLEKRQQKAINLAYIFVESWNRGRDLCRRRSGNRWAGVASAAFSSELKCPLVLRPSCFVLGWANETNLKRESRTMIKVNGLAHFRG